MDAIDQRIREDDDYINSRKHDFSLAAALEEHPDGLSLPAVAKVLNMSEEDAAAMYEQIVARLQKEVAS